jgi:hypothetical protein
LEQGLRKQRVCADAGDDGVCNVAGVCHGVTFCCWVW